MSETPAATDPAEPATDTPEQPSQGRPRNVIQALARVQAELGGIPKLTSAQRQKAGMGTGSGDGGISYAYRGIDQLAAAVQPLLGRYGIAIVPTKVTSTVTDLMMNGKPWTDERHKVRWTIYGPGGLGDYVTATTFGLGRDNSDKGANKASTGAYKNLLLRLFAIGDPSDDADHDRVETQSEPTISVEAQEAIRAVIAELPTEEERMEVRRQVAATWGRPQNILARDGADVQTFVLSKLREALATVGAAAIAVTEPVQPTLADDTPDPVAPAAGESPEPAAAAEPEPIDPGDETPRLRPRVGSRAAK